jgi:hypothetical protein
MQTDWARIDALTDDTIDTSDIPPLSQTFFQRAVLRTPLNGETWDVSSHNIRST